MKFRLNQPFYIKIGLGLFSFLVILSFQNCGKALLKSSNSDSSSSESPATSNPTNTGDSSKITSYNPVRTDLVCEDSDALKKRIITSYLHYLHRCPDRPGLDFWYHWINRNSTVGSTGELTALLQSLQTSSEFQNLNTPGQTPSDRYCIQGDTYQVLADSTVLNSEAMSAIPTTDTRVFSQRCSTSNPQNSTTAASMIIHDIPATPQTNTGGFVCSVPGNTLKNHIIELYLTYLDRCPESSGLDWWASNWSSDSSFVQGSDVQKYLYCRYLNGNINLPTQKDIDTCYAEQFSINWCPSGGKFVKMQFCEK